MFWNGGSIFDSAIWMGGLAWWEMWLDLWP